MIFINNAIDKIGADCLIVNLKAHNFFQGEGLRKEDFDQLFEVLKLNKNLNLPPGPKKQFVFMCTIL